MAKIIVVTNFSDSSHNALDYTCAFLGGSKASVLLLNIFSFPGSLSYDGVALAAMSETIADDERNLQREFDWVKANYPGINIRSEMISGGAFMEELRAKALEEEASFIVMGSENNYNELLSWGVNILDSVVDLETPVLVIPATVRYTPVKKIAFACDYCRKNLFTPVSMIRRIVQFTGAELHLLHIAKPAKIIDQDSINRKNALLNNLEDLSPVFYEQEFDNVVLAIDDFVNQNNIDMLIVIPSRRGVWESLFQKSHSKSLVSLNHIPILSLHQEGNFL